MEIGNFEDFSVVLKLEFEVKNWYIHSKQLPNKLGSHCATVWWCSITFFPSFNLSLNVLKFHLNSCVSPP